MVGNKGGGFRYVSGVQFQGEKNLPFFLVILEGSGGHLRFDSDVLFFNKKLIIFIVFCL